MDIPIKLKRPEDMLNLKTKVMVSLDSGKPAELGLIWGRCGANNEMYYDIRLEASQTFIQNKTRKEFHYFEVVEEKSRY